MRGSRTTAARQPELLTLVPAESIDPGRVFDTATDLDHIAEPCIDERLAHEDARHGRPTTGVRT